MIKIENLYCYYSEIEALHGIGMEVKTGEITCLIGNNGAGKSSLLKSISGMTTRRGSIKLTSGEEMIGLKARKIAHYGVIQVPEGRHCFPGLTVEQNLETGTINWHGFFGRESYKKELDEVFELFPRLEERKNQYAWSLSGGEQQMLAVGRAMMSRPKVLMLDEPSMGLAPKLVAELFQKIVKINREKKLTILIVEQNARQAMKISNFCYVLENGRIAQEGPAADLIDDPAVVKAYLGGLKKGH